VLGRFLGQEAPTQTVEAGIRGALARVGAELLRTVLQERVDHADARRATPPDMTRVGLRRIWVRSLWGDIPVWRAYYTRDGGGDGSTPADSHLGLWHHCTPALARTVSTLAVGMPFEAGAELLHLATAATVNGRQFHRLAAEAGAAAQRWAGSRRPTDEAPDVLYVSYDGVAVPMRKDCLAGRRGKGPDGKARTREMRLGCVFTQTTVGEDGQPVRDPDSTTYVAGLLDSERFGRLVKAEAVRRGARKARRVVVLSDGANWCGKAASVNFPRAERILDFYHAAEHLRDLSGALFGEGRKATVQFKAWRRALLRGKADDVIHAAEGLCQQAVDPDQARRHTAYLQHNRRHMQYDRYRKEGLFIGSGVVEAGCKTVVAQRTKLSGMLWGEAGLQHIVALRCLHLGHELPRFWDHIFGAQPAA
jgi:hypothetical protein